MVQYQHYIPQFLLRNFSHPYRPPKGDGSKKKKRARAEKGKHKGDKVLNAVDITSEEPQLTEVPVSRWFGRDEMYSDISITIKSNKDVEQELSRLESQASVILQKIKKAHERDDDGIRLTRIERNQLRKFLFIMKYRGPQYFEKYLSQDPQLYDSKDKYHLRDYMAEQGFATPRDVWLHNIRAILHLQMDAEGKWMEKIQKCMFLADAELFIFHSQHSYLALCTPKERDDEFILTDQCYNLFEGPIHSMVNARTGEYVGNTYLCFHEFAPVSPRLMVILRSNLLPEVLADKNTRIQKERKRFRLMASAQFPNPESVRSILEDLPVAKATNSYYNKIELAPGESGMPQSRDTFTFQFWPISTKDINTINAIFLDNLLDCNSIVFGTVTPFSRTLEAYMTTQTHGFKQIGVGEYGAKTTRLACLKKLTIVLKKLGVQNVPVIHNDPAPREFYTYSFDDTWLEIIKRFLEGREDVLENNGTLFWPTYRLLGGTQQTFLKDLEQSWRLCRFQVHIMHWTAGMESSVRKNAFACVLDIILKHHHKRVWLYVKHFRWVNSEECALHQQMFPGAAPMYAAKTNALFRPQIEDYIVQAHHTTDEDDLCYRIYSCAIVLPQIFELCEG